MHELDSGFVLLLPLFLLFFPNLIALLLDQPFNFLFVIVELSSPVLVVHDELPSFLLLPFLNFVF